MSEQSVLLIFFELILAEHYYEFILYFKPPTILNSF